MALAPLMTWHDMQRFMFPEQKWVDAVQEAQGVLKFLDLKPGSKILDIPCGVGRHSIQLSKQGMKITGVDITASFLDEAKKRALQQKAEVEWIEGDMLTYRAPHSFDAIVNLYTSFGYFSDPSDDEKVLVNFLASLKAGGKLLMDLMSREIFQSKMPPSLEKKNEDGSTTVSEHSFLQDGRWMQSKWFHMQDGKVLSKAEAGLRLYSQKELTDLLEKAGFAEVRAYGDFDGRPYSEAATHLVILARKA